MAIREILTYPDPRLRKVAVPVENPSSDDIFQLVADMEETMYNAPGVGLAATQIGVMKRLAITDTGWREEGAERDLKVWINPEITLLQGKSKGEEGCLSVPEEYEEVERATAIQVCWYDMSGDKHQATFEGFQAVALQHEFDHLDGKLFIDKLSILKQSIIKKRLRKRKKMGAQ
ncbi:MAG: peptide deformylase [Mariprofundaceae bacterium]